MSEMALELIHQAKREGWKRLDLGNCGLVGAVPEEVGELEGLEELNLSGRWIGWEAASIPFTGNVNSQPRSSSRKSLPPLA